MGSRRYRPGTFILIACVLCTACTSGCIHSAGDQRISTVTVAGSTTVLPFVQQCADEFMDFSPTTEILVSGGGSSVGIQAVGEGYADIGMASRDVKEIERGKYPELIQHVIARDGIAMIVHPANPVSAMTLEELRAVYRGDITNWNELGGSDMPIVVVGRDGASGTREFFHDRVMKKDDFVPTQLEKNSNGAIHQTVALTPGAIGYVGLGYIDDRVRALSISHEGRLIEPTTENVIHGDYPIARTLILVTRGQPREPVRVFLDFITGPDGQTFVEKEGFVRVA